LTSTLISPPDLSICEMATPLLPTIFAADDR
jgi:hypothetical protein